MGARPDGTTCGIPVWSVPLDRLARGWAQLLGDGAGGLLEAVALEVRDGASRAADVALEWLLARIGAGPAPPPMVRGNRAGTAVGELRVVG
mgnify:CR=1 FL=1